MKNLVIRNPDLEEKIIKLYCEGQSAKNILISLNNPFKTTKSIYDILRKHSIKTRDSSDSHRIIERNSWYFSNIDTKEKAYILGLMITDGWLCKERNSIGFSSTDLELTKIISEQISNGSSITTIKSKEHKIFDKTVIKKESYQYQLYDDQLKCDLIKLGFQLDKTFNEFLPYLEERFMSHLIRGIFDGDGCIYELSNVFQPGIIFYSGSELLLKQISTFLWTNLRFSPPEIKSSTVIYKISYTKFKEVERLMSYLYEDSKNLRLNRKYNIWKKYENKVN